MSITAKNESKGGNFEQVPAGNYVARCIRMVNIGTIEEEILGKKKMMNKVAITFELPTEQRVFKEGDPESPYLVQKEFNLSMNEKATIRLYMESWRGKKFTDEEAVNVDISKMLGKSCMINVVHKMSKKGTAFPDIASITPLPKGLTCPPQINPTFEFGYEPFDKAKFDTLPEWIQKKIMLSEEYNLHTSKPQIETVVDEEVDEEVDDLLF